MATKRSWNLMENAGNLDAFNRLSDKAKWKQLCNIQKPARPLNGYTQYVTEYMKRNKGTTTKMTMANAAQAWKALSDEERNLWDQASQQGKDAYTREAANYNRAKKALRKPPSAFALFVKDRWKIERKKKYPGGKRPPFAVIHKQIVRDWKRCSDKERRKYFKTTQHLLDLFMAERAAVLAGEREFNLFWAGEEAPEAEDEEGEINEE